MIYQIFKLLFYPTLKAYFRSLYINNAYVIPDKGPVIFAVNHTSAFMDPILIAVFTKRTLHFLARGEAFNSILSRAFYKKLNMLPVYRPETTPDEVHKNKFAFQACHVHLKNQKTIIIFPEGFSQTGRRLRPIKPGLARIAFGAEAENDFKLNVKIIPIGINYSDQHRFRSDVIINYGTPIEVGAYRELYEQNEKNAIRNLTEEVRLSLAEQLVLIDDEKHDMMIHQIEKLYFSEEEHIDNLRRKAKKRFELSKEIAETIDYFAQENSEEFKLFEGRLNNYMKILERLKLDDHHMFRSNVSMGLLRSFFYFVLGFPVFVFGYLLNIIPFKLADLVSKKIPVREDFIGSLKITSGAFIFLIFYILEAFVVKQFTNSYWTIIFLCLLYPTGIFALNYVKRFYAVLDTIKYLRISSRKMDFIERLRFDRDEMINTIEKWRIEYSGKSDKRADVILG